MKHNQSLLTALGIIFILLGVILVLVLGKWEKRGMPYAKVVGIERPETQWMWISPEGIKFNREYFSDWSPDNFAEAFISKIESAPLCPVLCGCMKAEGFPALMPTPTSANPPSFFDMKYGKDGKGNVPKYDTKGK